jgi:hypothetical protein
MTTLDFRIVGVKRTQEDLGWEVRLHPVTKVEGAWCDLEPAEPASLPCLEEAARWFGSRIGEVVSFASVVNNQMMGGS